MVWLKLVQSDRRFVRFQRNGYRLVSILSSSNVCMVIGLPIFAIETSIPPFLLVGYAFKSSVNSPPSRCRFFWYRGTTTWKCSTQSRKTVWERWHLESSSLRVWEPGATFRSKNLIANICRWPGMTWWMGRLNRFFCMLEALQYHDDILSDTELKAKTNQLQLETSANPGGNDGMLSGSYLWTILCTPNAPVVF